MRMTKKELENLYYSHTNETVCEILGVSKVTMLSYLKKAGIALKGKGGGMRASKVTIITEEAK